MQKTVVVSAILEKKQWQFLRETAREKNLSASWLLRHLVSSYQEGILPVLFVPREK